MSPSQIRRRIANGQWVQVLANVYRLSAAPPTWRGRLYAAILWSGPNSAASHLSAAALWSLPTFEEGPLDIITTRDIRSDEIRVHRVDHLLSNQIVRLGFLRVTSPIRTLFDIGSVASVDQIEAALDDFLRRRLIALPRLERLLMSSPHRGHKGTGSLRNRVRERLDTGVTESEFERRLKSLIRQSGLPNPTTQLEVRSRSEIIGRIDFAYEEEKLAIEADSYRFHSSRTAWVKDQTRTNRLSALGWRVIKVTWDDLTKRPGQVINTIRGSLGKN